MAAIPKVFIAYRQLLLARALEGALRADSGVEVVACERIESDLSERIRALRADVLVMDRCDIAGEIDVAVHEMCRENPGLKVIAIDHGANVVNVFRVYYQQVVVSDLADIIGIVRNAAL